MEPNPTTGYFPILNYTVPQGGLPLRIREGIVSLARRYRSLFPSAVICEGTYRLFPNPCQVDALAGFKEGEVVNFETSTPERMEEIRKNLEVILTRSEA